jgi:DnaJ-class molecular chaperone
VKVPPNTSSGKRLRIKGHGRSPANQPAGDLFAEIEIELPENLTEEEPQAVGRNLELASAGAAELRW